MQLSFLASFLLTEGGESDVKRQRNDLYIRREPNRIGTIIYVDSFQNFPREISLTEGGMENLFIRMWSTGWTT